MNDEPRNLLDPAAGYGVTTPWDRLRANGTTITARFRSRCARCGGYIRAGEQVYYLGAVRVGVGSSVLHLTDDVCLARTGRRPAWLDAVDAGPGD